MRAYLIESTLLQNNISRAYKLQMELQSTLVHEALAAVVALDRRIKLRANVLEGAVARPGLRREDLARGEDGSHGSRTAWCRGMATDLSSR